MQEKLMFRRDFEERRCLIPAGKFYEWKKIGVKQKEKYEFFAPDEILYLAGIYHKDPTGTGLQFLPVMEPLLWEDLKYLKKKHLWR